MSRTKRKPVKAWAATFNNGELAAFGNGKQWQFPIFPTRKEARDWVADALPKPIRIVRVTIAEAK